MTNDGLITSCTGSLVPQVNQLSCVTPSPNCKELNDSDNTLCKVCNTPNYFLDDDKLCYDCADPTDGIDVNCDGVTNEGLITSCTDEFIP